MKIIQLLASFAYGDAIGNDTMAIHDILVEEGYDAAIYAVHIHERLKSKPGVYYINSNGLPKMKEDDVLIFHMSNGTELVETIQALRCKKIMIYHNITPYEYFSPYDKEIAERTKEGLLQVKEDLREVFDYCIAASQFNKQNLLSYGYTCPIDVVPIVIPFEDYKKKPNEEIIQEYKDFGITNILFVGRIAPNKKYEDIILSFHYYKKRYNPTARLFFVGSWVGMEGYYQRLRQYISFIGVRDVMFIGAVPFDAILSYYQIADLFLCMSEHEGFCVPLLEAMMFQTPILAYRAAACPDTLGIESALLDSKNPLYVAARMDEVLEKPEVRNELVSQYPARLRAFAYSSVKKMFLNYLEIFLKGDSL